MIEIEVLDSTGARAFHDNLPVDSLGPLGGGMTTGIGNIYPHTAGGTWRLRGRVIKADADFRNVRTMVSLNRPFEADREAWKGIAVGQSMIFVYVGVILMIGAVALLVAARLQNRRGEAVSLT